MMSTGKYVEVDQEWIVLMKEAKSIGLSIEEVRLILNKNQEVSKS